MNIFLPVNHDKVELGLDGHYTLSGSYMGRKFIVDDINPLELRLSYHYVIDDIAGRGLPIERRFQATPAKPFNPAR